MKKRAKNQKDNLVLYCSEKDLNVELSENIKSGLTNASNWYGAIVAFIVIWGALTFRFNNRNFVEPAPGENVCLDIYNNENNLNVQKENLKKKQELSRVSIQEAQKFLSENPELLYTSPQQFEKKFYDYYKNNNSLIAQEKQEFFIIFRKTPSNENRILINFSDYFEGLYNQLLNGIELHDPFLEQTVQYLNLNDFDSDFLNTEPILSKKGVISAMNPNSLGSKNRTLVRIPSSSPELKDARLLNKPGPSRDKGKILNFQMSGVKIIEGLISTEKPSSGHKAQKMNTLSTQGKAQNARNISTEAKNNLTNAETLAEDHTRSNLVKSTTIGSDTTVLDATGRQFLKDIITNPTLYPKTESEYQNYEFLCEKVEKVNQGDIIIKTKRGHHTKEKIPHANSYTALVNRALTGNEQTFVKDNFPDIIQHFNGEETIYVEDLISLSKMPYLRTVSNLTEEHKQNFFDFKAYANRIARSSATIVIDAANEERFDPTATSRWKLYERVDMNNKLVDPNMIRETPEKINEFDFRSQVMDPAIRVGDTPELVLKAKAIGLSNTLSEKK